VTRRSETCRPAMFGLLGMLRGTVGTRDLGQRITRHRELSDNSLEVEYGSRQRSERAQGALVGLVPDTEARAVPGRSRGSREWSIRLRTELLSEVEYEEGLSFERSCTAVNISPIWVYPTVRRTPHRQSRYPRQSASSRNILHVSWMVRRQSAPGGHGTGFRRSVPFAV
jgi:hypothetical protein